ncbi:MAG: gamma-glutamylcyclotransferase [Alphaproteobacteria bacterium]
MSHFTYFAYGSNMLNERLQARCASAQMVDVAIAPGHELFFLNMGRDDSAKATLIPAENTAQQVQGVVFNVERSELAALDWFEGERYNRIDDFQVFTTSGAISAVTYIAPCTSTEPGQQPYDWYLALILAGALQHGFDDAYVSFLRQITTSKPDLVPNREGRLKALAALEKSGYGYLLDEFIS